MLNMTMEEILKSGQVLEEYLDRQINRLKENTYHFQKQQQLDLVVLERYDFNMGDFDKKVVDNTVTPIRHKYLTFVDFDFVAPQRRLRFKRSGLMGKELSQYDVSTKADVFDKNFMVFIEGKLVDCIKIIPNEQGIDLVLAMKTGMEKTGVNESEFNAWRRAKTPATIIFFNNSDFNPMIVNREVLRKNGQFLSLRESGIVDELETDERYLTFVTTKDNGFDSHLVFTPERKEMLSFFESMDSWAPILTRAHINIYGFRNLSEEIVIPGSVTSFQIPGYKRPIPTENILVFRNTVAGKRLASDIKLKKHYPNFYTIEGNINNDSLHLLVFYSDDNEQDKGFRNELAAYYETLGDTVDTFNKAPDIVRDYQPYEFDYSIRDYRESGFDTPYEYKLHILNMLADVHPENLLDFLKEQYTTTDGLFVNMQHIDLEQRERDNNHGEIDDPYQQVEFDEKRYVITLKDIEEGGKYTYNLYIDGLRYIPDHTYRRGKYSYTYIPADLIQPDTILEIERFELFENTKTAVLDADNATTRMIVKGNYNRGDIYIVDENGEYIAPDKFRVFTAVDCNFVTYEPDNLNFIPHEEVYITLLDPANYGKVTINVDRYHTFNVEVMTQDMIYTFTNMELDAQPLFEKFRVFSNGRHVPNSMFDVDFSGKHLSNTIVTSGVPQKAGDRVLFEYTPNRYERLLNIDVLPQGNIISLHGITERPFSLSWYDLYLNGRRLTKNNIRLLSPYLIQLINVDSVNTFEIYARESYADAITSNTKTIIDELFEQDPDFQEGLQNYDTNSTDSELDIFEEVFYFYLLELKRFWLNEMKASFYHINPDIDQITPEVQARYPKLFSDITYMHLNGTVYGPEEFGVEILHINPDDIAASPYALNLYDLYLFLRDRGAHINPDETIESSITDQFPVVFGEGNGVFVNPDTVYMHPQSPLMHMNPDN